MPEKGRRLTARLLLGDRDEAAGRLGEARGALSAFVRQRFEQPQRLAGLGPARQILCRFERPVEGTHIGPRGLQETIGFPFEALGGQQERQPRRVKGTGILRDHVEFALPQLQADEDRGARAPDKGDEKGQHRNDLALEGHGVLRIIKASPSRTATIVLRRHVPSAVRPLPRRFISK